jgi:hypothetical protein
MSILISLMAELIKAALPELLSFAWEKAHVPTTIEDAAPDADRRQRLLDAIRMRGSAGGGNTHNGAAATG